MARQIVVDIVGDSSKFKKATGEAASSAGGLQSKLKGVGTGLVIGAGAAAFGAVTAAAGLAISKLDEAHTAFLEDASSQDALALAISHVSKAHESTIASIEDRISANQALGVSDSDQRSGMQEFINLTGDVDDALRLNQAAIELSAATGKTYAEAVDEIKSGITGRTKALAKDGIAVKKGADAMDIATAIMDKYQGSQEAVSKTAEGKLAVSNEKVGEAMEKIGGIIDHVSQAVIPIFADALTVAVDVLGQVWTAIEPIATAIGSTLTPILQALLPVVQTVFGAFLTYVRAITPVVQAVFGIIGQVISIAVGVAKAEFAVFGTVIGILGNAFSALASVVSGVWNGITSAIKSAINVVIGAVNTVIRALNGIQIHVPSVGVGPVQTPSFDWNGLNLPQIPTLHTGGIVPGPAGQERLILAQAGETVTPIGGRTGVTLAIYGNVYTSSMDEFADTLERKLNARGAWG